MKAKRLFISFLLAAVFSSPVVRAQGNNNANSKPTACDFQADMRKLWEDHITWTRNVIFNFIDTLPGTNEAVGRLLQNQVDIGNAIKPYYGNAAGNQLTAHLTNHILIAADILVALRTGNTAAFNVAYANWFLNADTIAALLASVNPNWPLPVMTDMMHEHLNATTAEVLARLNANYAADVVAYDSIHNQILRMADMLAMGIVKQFPNKFKGGAVMRFSQNITLDGNNVVMEQNAPNPFKESTVISFYVPETVNKAEVRIYDNTGRMIRAVPVTERGQGELNINAGKLGNGNYTYSIIADGAVIDSRKMTHLQ
jgi:hypothetical protein